jgi:ABC-type glycerol-3-phosphate transport system permease component
MTNSTKSDMKTKKIRLSSRDYAGKILMYGFLSLAASIVIIPLLTLFVVSLQSPDSTATNLSWPEVFYWQNYVIAWTKGDFPLPRLMLNSLIVALVVVPVTVTVSVLAGYAFGTLKFPARNIIFGVFMIGLIMPFESTIVPLYYQLRSLGLINSLPGVILPQVGLFCAFGIFWMRQFFLATPVTLIEAAKIDGASTTRILRSVLLPISWPPILTLASLVFIWSWNEFLLALVVLDRENKTAPSGLASFTGQWVQDIPALSAAAIIVALPTIVLYVALNRKIISGILQGSVKG